MEENILIVDKENGNKIKLNVIDIITIEELNKEYIIYTIDGDSEDNIYASILEENETTYRIKSIDSAEEWKIVQNIINEISLNSEGE